jgi:DNA primase
MDKHSIAVYLEYIGATLPQIGSGWRKMKCPFHEDSHASAGINYDKSRFNCLGCGVTGDVYDLIMQREGGNYHEALKFAETISPASNNRVRQAYKPGDRVSTNTQSIGRRGSSISSGSSKGRSSRS